MQPPKDLVEMLTGLTDIVTLVCTLRLEGCSLSNKFAAYFFKI